MSVYYLNGIKTEINRDIIKDYVIDNLPRKWMDEGCEDIVDEIVFRIADLEFENIDFNIEERYTLACIDYILEEGRGDPIGIDLLINENDDGRIWNYL